MVSDLSNSIEGLYRKKFSFKLLFMILSIIIFTIIYLFFFTYKYDVYTVKGLISCDTKCSISITTDATNTEILKKGDKIYLDEKEYDIKKVNISEIKTDYEALESYQTITYELAKKIDFKEEIVTLNILSNKHTLIDKINPFRKGG